MNAAGLARIHRAALAALLLAGLLRPVALRAQAILPEEAPEAPVPQMETQAQFESEGPPPGPQRAATPLTFGNLVLRPHAMYSYMQEEGLLYSPGNDRSSSIENFSAGLLANWGQNWSANYTPTWIHYSNPLFHGGLDQLADIEAIFSPANWLLQLSQTASISVDPQIETGAQTTMRNYATSLALSKSLAEQLALDFSFSQSIGSANVLFPENRQWTGSGGVRYQWLPQITFSLDASAGFFEVVHSTNGYFVSPTLGLAITTWSRKITLDASVGAKRQVYYQRDKQSAATSPSAHLDLKVIPWQTTSFELQADTGETFSQLTDDGLRRTDWGITWNQQILSHLMLSVSGMRTQDNYQTFGYQPGLDVPLARNDLINSLNASLGLVNLFKRASIKAVFEAGRNNSSIAVYNYDTHEIGIQLSYAY